MKTKTETSSFTINALDSTPDMITTDLTPEQKKVMYKQALKQNTLTVKQLAYQSVLYDSKAFKNLVISAYMSDAISNVMKRLNHGNKKIRAGAITEKKKTIMLNGNPVKENQSKAKLRTSKTQGKRNKTI